MKKTGLRIGCIVLAMATLFTLTACSKPIDEGSSEPSVTTTTTAAPTRYMNLLTGEEDLETPNNRPVAFMIGNSSYTKDPLQQKGIDKADFYMETETEGGITRIMAVFGSAEKIPNEIGPVRSARTPFVKIVKALDAVYCHVGGSVYGKQMIKDLKVNDIDGLTVVSEDLRKVNGNWNEHVKVFTKQKTLSAIDSRKLSKTTGRKSPYQFGEKTGTGLGNKLQVNMSSSARVSFVYDPATKLYTKNRYALDTQVHKSYEGGAITVSNVIVMYDNRYYESDGKIIAFTLNSGNGLLVSGGTSRDIKWTRTDGQLSFFEADGTPLTVAKGKTYLCLTSTQQQGKTILQ